MRISRSYTGDDQEASPLRCAPAKQNSDGCANNILQFVTRVMNPVRHVGNRDYFESERGKLNDALTFSGLPLGEDAKLRKVTTARIRLLFSRCWMTLAPTHLNPLPSNGMGQRYY